MSLSLRTPGARVAAGVTGLAVVATAAVAVGTSSADATPARPTPAATVVASMDRAYPAGTTRPTIVLVHGAWADASSWAGEIAIFQQAGFPVRAFTNPVLNLTTDSQTLVDYLQMIPGPLVLVGHSYGGSVITEASAEVGSRVKALVYIDAIAPNVGENNNALIGKGSYLTNPKPLLYDRVPYPGAPTPNDEENYLKQSVFVHQFASSVNPTEAQSLYYRQSGAADPAFTVKATGAGWKTIPSWYFISTGDTIITPASMTRMATRAHSTVTTYQGGSHLTLVSDPTAVAGTIALAVAAVR